MDDEEKEQQKEIREKLESEGIDPDELNEDPPSREASRFSAGWRTRGTSRMDAAELRRAGKSVRITQTSQHYLYSQILENIGID